MVVEIMSNIFDEGSMAGSKEEQNSIEMVVENLDIILDDFVQK